MTDDSEAPRSDGLLGSLRQLGRDLIEIVHTRLEIASTEIAEERVNLTRLALVSLIILFCVQCGVLLGVLFIVLAVGSEYRLMAVGITSLALLLAAAAGVLWLRAWLKKRPPMFATTIAEFRKDRDRLRGKT